MPRPSRATARRPSSESSQRAVDRAAERVADGRRPPLPAARRLDRRERALAAVRERAEQDLVVGPGARQPSASARATSTEVSEPLNESGAISTPSAPGCPSRQRCVEPSSATRSPRSFQKKVAALGWPSSPVRSAWFGDRLAEHRLPAERSVHRLGRAAGHGVEDEHPAAVGARPVFRRGHQAPRRCRGDAPTGGRGPCRSRRDAASSGCATG